jgi:hypothetical protein
MKIGVVTAFVPLNVKHLTAMQYHELGARLQGAVLESGAEYCKFLTDKLEDCWLAKENPPMVPANPVPGDRYAGPVENVQSNIVQHNRTEWALRAAATYPDVDVWVWLDYGILKQGAWRNNPVTEESVVRFLQRLGALKELSYIPFPGITAPQPVYPTGNVWRFCGSVHIWPKPFLPDIDRAYKATLRKWIVDNNTTPLDLPIWALVEQNSALPFRFYQAEYDASQLTGFLP